MTFSLYEKFVGLDSQQYTGEKRVAQALLRASQLECQAGQVVHGEKPPFEGGVPEVVNPGGVSVAGRDTWWME